MKVKKMFTLLAMMSALSWGSTIYAYPNCSDCNETIPLTNWGFTVDNGEMRSVKLDNPAFVKTLYMTVEALGSNYAQVQIKVNGEERAQFPVPVVDPHVSVSIERTTSSIEIVVLSGRLKVKSIKAVVIQNPNYRNSPVPDYQYGQFPHYSDSVMSRISARAIYLVEQLSLYTNYADYGAYLLPIKSAAAQALAYSDARGDASRTARPTFEILLKYLDRAQPYLMNNFQIQSAYPLAVELMSLREKARMKLD
ncbi:MAG TPA: hypothetical protein PLJ21_05700 [Pseudobdellovibrionaceae bacterium]|nr:hypothetical protein [Pseudobdellovibrionaceae bacterium]